MQAGPVQRLAQALPVVCPLPVAEGLIEQERHGRLGLGREQLEWVKLTWCPATLLETTTSNVEGGFLRRRALKTTWHWNLYEAVAGPLVESLGGKRLDALAVEGTVVRYCGLVERHCSPAAW